MLACVSQVFETKCANPDSDYKVFWRALFCALLIFGITHLPVTVAAQDISGGAGEGVKRPVESPPRRRAKTTSKSKSVKRGANASTSSAPASQPKVDVSKQVDAALELGNAARDGNPPRYNDAELAYKLAVGLDPDDSRAYVGLGNTYFDQKRFPEAETALIRAIELDPNDEDALVALAFTLNAQDRFKEAEVPSLRAIAIDASNFAAHAALGWSKYSQKIFPEAEVAYRRAIALSPKTPEIYAELGLVFMAQANWHDSEPVLLQATTLDPTNPGTLLNYGIVLHKLGQLDKATESYEKVIKLNPKTSSPHSNLALIYYTRGDFVRAREEWEAALQLNSSYAPDRAGLLILDRKFDEANAELDKYTKANDTDEDGWLLVGDVRRMLHDSTGSNAAYARAAQLTPNYAKSPRPTLPEPASAKSVPEKNSVASETKTSVSAKSNTAETSPVIGQQVSSAAPKPKLLYSTSVRTIRATNNARPTTASGTISVSCNPNATVLVEFVGGGEALMSVVPSSPTVVAFNQLRPGEYRVVAMLEGFETVETRVFVAVTRIVSIKLTMRRST